MSGHDENNRLLDVTVADLVSRHPGTAALFQGPGLALFANSEVLSSGGVLLRVGEALAQRGISADLFLALLDNALEERLFSTAA